MQLVIDENEQQHIYSCLLVGATEFGKVKKTLAKLDRDDPEIDEQIALNAKLKRMFNPRAEEEARASSRKDDAQLDLTEVGSSGETGGGIPAGQTFSLNTGERRSDAEIRDALLELGVAIMLDDVNAWSIEEARIASEFVDAARNALASGEPQPDYPECVYRDGTTMTRMQELLASGPYRVEQVETEDIGTEFEVCRDSADDPESIDVDSTEPLRLDAEIRAARLNRTELQRADMSDEEVAEWAAKGPWAQEIDEFPDRQDQYFIIAGTQREQCESYEEALGRAARYNRSIAERHVEPMYEVVDEQAAEAAVAHEQEVEIVAVAGSDQAH